jgi:TRAP-type C4-dicarboxylate transport system substrate-binding protein
MKKLSDDQLEQVKRAATDAGIAMRAQVANETSEVRNWLVEKGGMAITTPNKADFVKAGKMVQDRFAKERGAEFVELVAKIQAAAN